MGMGMGIQGFSGHLQGLLPILSVKFPTSVFSLKNEFDTQLKYQLVCNSLHTGAFSKSQHQIYYHYMSLKGTIKYLYYSPPASCLWEITTCEYSDPTSLLPVLV